MSDYDGGFGGSQRQHMTDSGASIIEKLDNADLRRALHTKSELIINLRLDIQNCEAKRAGAIDSLREHIEICNELKKDAERYRWLLEAGKTGGQEGGVTQRGVTIVNGDKVVLHLVYWTTKEGFDAAIDASRGKP